MLELKKRPSQKLKSPRGEFHPQAEATRGNLGSWGVGWVGGWGAQGFPSPELVLTSLAVGAKVKFQPTRSVSGPWGSSQPKSQRTVVSAANIDSINLGSHKMITFSFAMAYQYHDVFLTIPAQDSQPKSQLRVTSIGSLPKNENCLYLGKVLTCEPTHRPHRFRTLDVNLPKILNLLE